SLEALRSVNSPSGAATLTPFSVVEMVTGWPARTSRGICDLSPPDSHEIALATKMGNSTLRGISLALRSNPTTTTRRRPSSPAHKRPSPYEVETMGLNQGAVWSLGELSTCISA